MAFPQTMQTRVQTVQESFPRVHTGRKRATLRQTSAQSHRVRSKGAGKGHLRSHHGRHRDALRYLRRHYILQYHIHRRKQTTQVQRRTHAQHKRLRVDRNQRDARKRHALQTQNYIQRTRRHDTQILSTRRTQPETMDRTTTTTTQTRPTHRQTLPHIQKSHRNHRHKTTKEEHHRRHTQTNIQILQIQRTQARTTRKDQVHRQRRRSRRPELGAR